MRFFVLTERIMLSKKNPSEIIGYRKNTTYEKVM